MDTPLLILAWRRPHTLRQVINAIRLVAPTRLYVACDGPNPDRLGESEKVAATRAVIESEIDWPCQIERLYSDVNQGCRLGVSRAITWFFDQVEEGIILEDDCVPHPDFFNFCSKMLSFYRYDMRIWCISGNNFQDSTWAGSGDYFFGQIPMCWGWATWRSRWIHYDAEMKRWPASKKVGLLHSVITDPVARSYWSKIWDKLWVSNKPDSWAYRWAFTCVIERGLTVLPKVNLVENVGYGEDATHTRGGNCSRQAFPLGTHKISHPEFVASLRHNDMSIFNNHYGGHWLRFPFNYLKFPLSLLRKVAKFIAPFLR